MINRVKKIIYSIKWNCQKWKFLVGKSSVNEFSVVAPECISIGKSFYAEANLKLQAWKNYESQKFTPNIKIGDDVSMMENCQISCCSEIIIGDGCLFGANVFITDNFHGNSSLENLRISPLERDLYVKGPVHIGKNVWIGRNVCVMPNVTIGDGVVIGANSVVTHDVKDYSVVAGAPAREIEKVVD